ncbi:MAG: hypothetical protein EA384_16940, partial [Spirochaetaceae bacterium]
MDEEGGDGVGDGTAAGGAVSVLDWGQGYLVFSGRYSHPLNERFVPYVEVGLGWYLFMYVVGLSWLHDWDNWAEGLEDDMYSDPVLGFRFALGTSFSAILILAVRRRTRRRCPYPQASGSRRHMVHG